MIQQIGYFFSLFLAILAGVFFLIGIYVGYKNYAQLPLGGKTGYQYFFFGAFGFGLALFSFLTTEMGFSWENVIFSLVLTSLLAIFLKINDIIRIKTAKFLYKSTGTLSPLSPMMRLLNILINRNPADPKPNTSNENNKR